jgi:SEC-C motif domain protein
MRSRYAAYARHLADYIIATTHPDNPSYSLQIEQWKHSILDFCRTTHFENLTIHAFIDGAKEAYVDFTAHLKQQNIDTTFREKSHFVKEKGRWFYKNAILIER